MQNEIMSTINTARVFVESAPVSCDHCGDDVDLEATTVCEGCGDYVCPDCMGDEYCSDCEAEGEGE